jgi:hypothetical protein
MEFASPTQFLMLCGLIFALLTPVALAWIIFSIVRGSKRKGKRSQPK